MQRLCSDYVACGWWRLAGLACVCCWDRARPVVGKLCKDETKSLQVAFSMGVSAPVKYALHKFAADLLGAGSYVTPVAFATLTLLTAAVSPLLVARHSPVSLPCGRHESSKTQSCRLYACHDFMFWRIRV